jgi:hypothetical protein
MAKKKTAAPKETAAAAAPEAPAAETPAAETKAAAAKKAPARKPAAKKTAASKDKSAAKPAGAPATPFIDTGLAAQTAARLIAAKATGGAQGSDAPRPQTSTFKQLKDSLTKGHSASVHSVLNSSMSPAAKKSNLPFQGGKQTGHNQTFGADASRNFVPRRTGG